MQPIEFIGVRGGHGTTTVALATAATLATRGPTLVAARDRRSLCALAGIAEDGLPIPLAENLRLADPNLDPARLDGVTAVTDCGTLRDERTAVDDVLDDDTLTDAEVAAALHALQKPTGALRIGVMRGPDYLGMRTLCDHPEVRLDGIVVVSETTRALEPRDVEHVTGRRVVAVVDHTPAVARMIDAGLLLQRVGRLREFAQLRTWITQIAAQEASCTVAS